MAPRLLAAFDKFKGTATSGELAEAACAAARAAGWVADGLALSDGGEGLLEAAGGANRVAVVTAPDGRRIEAPWRRDGEVAVLESARASGLALVGGAANNDPVAATSRGTGELVQAAVEDGARRIVLGLGGSATTDGGTGALAALTDATVTALREGRVALDVCCDVTTRFTDAAAVFGPQKGADKGQVAELTARLRRQQADLLVRWGVDVAGLAGGGAAGGLGGAFAALGGRLRPGFDVVAEMVGLDRALDGADLVVTGEGQLDASSLAGKVVGGVVARASRRAVPVVVVVGRVAHPAPVLAAGVRVVSLVEAIGERRAMSGTAAAVADVLAAVLADPDQTSSGRST